MNITHPSDAAGPFVVSAVPSLSTQPDALSKDPAEILAPTSHRTPGAGSGHFKNP